MDKALSDVLGKIVPIAQEIVIKASERTAQLLMPPRALGRLHDIAERLCGIGRTLTPDLREKAILVFAGDHGVAVEGVSAYPQDITTAMVHTFLAGGAGINAIARHVGADVFVVDMGIAKDLDRGPLPNANKLRMQCISRGTRNFTREPAMTRGQAEEAVMKGFQAASERFAQGCQLIGTGDMGIGNTTASAAIGMCICKAGADEMIGRGAGVDSAGLARKKNAIVKALELHQPVAGDGLDVLAKVGGFEIGGIAGCILAAAFHNKPVVVDGFISTAGALIAHVLCPHCVDYMFAGHLSAEPGHGIMLKHLGLEPILQLGMRLGEGTGAALAMGIIDAAVHVHTEVMTFAEANVQAIKFIE
ncbi:MAG: nicotinate-nucleotide--dimethylbenzimidazole phosphoribosyltransferase [Gammaproteobacteria bacterium]